MAIDAGSLAARKSLSLIIFIIIHRTRWIFEAASLQKPSRKRSSGSGFDDLQTQLRRSFLEQLHLLFAVALLVVLQTLVHVLMSPLEHAIDQDGQLVGHGRNRFRCAESAAEAAILGAEV